MSLFVVIVLFLVALAGAGFLAKLFPNLPVPPMPVAEEDEDDEQEEDGFQFDDDSVDDIFPPMYQMRNVDDGGHQKQTVNVRLVKEPERSQEESEGLNNGTTEAEMGPTEDR